MEDPVRVAAAVDDNGHTFSPLIREQQQDVSTMYAEVPALAARGKAEFEKVFDAGLAHEEDASQQLALECFGAAYVMARELNYRFGEAMALERSARCCRALHQHTRALAMLEGCVRLYGAQANAFGVATSLRQLGQTYAELGRLGEAADMLARSCDAAAGLGDAPLRLGALVNLAMVRLRQERPDEALRLLGEGLGLTVAIGDSAEEIRVLQRMAAAHGALARRWREQAGPGRTWDGEGAAGEDAAGEDASGTADRAAAAEQQPTAVERQPAAAEGQPAAEGEGTAVAVLEEGAVAVLEGAVEKIAFKEAEEAEAEVKVEEAAEEAEVEAAAKEVEVKVEEAADGAEVQAAVKEVQVQAEVEVEVEAEVEEAASTGTDSFPAMSEAEARTRWEAAEFRAVRILRRALELAERQGSGASLRVQARIRMSVQGIWMSVVGIWMSVVGIWMRMIGIWMSVIGTWMSVVGTWMSVIVIWMSVIVHPFSPGRMGMSPLESWALIWESSGL